MRVSLVGDLHYPAVQVVGENGPIFLFTVDSSRSLLAAKWEKSVICSQEEVHTPVFFFIYNTDNYYHFVWNSLPYIKSYLVAKLRDPDLKLLMSYPYGLSEHYRFVTDFLYMAGVETSDILIAKNAVYTNLMVGLVGDIDRRKILRSMFPVTTCGSRRLYVSRRSWIHGDASNMGTNYTTRRKCENEDELVRYLNTLGYDEIFPEIMSVKEKLATFGKASKIIGAIGGGMVNTVFSDAECSCIVSPTFLETNYNFTKCLNARYFNGTEHVEKDEFKKYMRTQVWDEVGEIVGVGERLTVAVSRKQVAGFNSEVEFDTIVADRSDCIRLDNGLNSEWRINMEEFKKWL